MRLDVLLSIYCKVEKNYINSSRNVIKCVHNTSYIKL